MLLSVELAGLLGVRGSGRDGRDGREADGEEVGDELGSHDGTL